MRMLKILLTLLSFALISQMANAQVQTATLRVFFDSGKFTLNAAAQTRLDSLADSLLQALKYELRVVGHADHRGDSLGNAALSTRRTEAVSNFLAQKNIVVKKTLSLGDRRPLQDGDDPNDLAQNRRVEIQARYVPKPTPDPVSSSTISDLYALLAEQPQTFCINPARDTILRCKDGTVIQVNAASFVVKDPCSKQCVTLRVKEVFEKSSMVFENLSTTSNGRVLESQGMIYTELEDCQGRNLELLPGKAMVISMPSNRSAAGFQMFQGWRKGPKGDINWVSDPRAQLSGTGVDDLAFCPNASSGIGQAKRCRFFFCRIRTFFQKLKLGKSVKRQVVPAQRSDCGKLTDLCKKYGIKNEQAFLNALNFELLDSLGYKSATEMMEKMDPGQLDAMMLNFGKTKVPREQYQYNMFNSTRTGWANCDAFQALPPSEITNVKIDIQGSPMIDCKLIFARQNILLSGVNYNNLMYVQGVQKNIPATLIVLKYEDGKAYFSKTAIITAAGPFKVDFKEYSIPELKKELQKLDFVAS